MRILPALAALSLVGAGQTPPAPLQPTGKWGVDYGVDSCTLSRTFGAGDQSVMLGIMPLTGGDAAKIVMIGSAHAKLSGRGVVTVGRGEDGKPIERNYYSDKDPATGRPVTMIKAYRTDLAAAVATERLTLKAKRQDPLDFALPGIAAAMKAMDACEADLAKTWGFDPALVATPPQGIEPGKWLNSDDYPKEAIQGGKVGETDFRLTVAADGKASDCVVTLSSGSELLDKKACALIPERGRFQPALGKDGKPIAGLYANSVLWMLPGSWERSH